MKGKRQRKRKIGKIMLLSMSFLLTIVLTFTITMAWFFDSDWANNYVTMAGSVGIKIQDYLGTHTSGEGQLHFKLSTDKAYPGQAVRVSAEVHNDGGKSGANGSDCYVRAHFQIYTNIGTEDTTGMTEAEIEEFEENAGAFDSDQLYNFMTTLITSQNETSGTDYCWNFYQAPATPLSSSGISDSDIKVYLDGLSSGVTVANDSIYDKDNNGKYTDSGDARDRGYFYLCYKKGVTFQQKIPDTTSSDELAVTNQNFTTTNTKVLKPLKLTDTSIFLWNSTFIIPWTLTNYSADKIIYIAVTFQAVQTFIPEMKMSDGQSTGLISTAANNQLIPSLCTYDNISVSTVFNTCNFRNATVPEALDKNGDGIVDSGFDTTTTPPGGWTESNETYTAS